MDRFRSARRRLMACGWLLAASIGVAAGQEITPPDRPVTLEEAIEIAVQNHAIVAVGEEGVVISRQRLRQAKTGTLPQITGDLSYSVRGTSNVGGIFGSRGAGNTATSDRGVQPAVRARQTIVDGGQTRIGVRQARVGVESAEAGLQSVRNNLAFTVSTNYLAQLRAQAVLALRIEQVRQAESQLQDVLERIRVGTLADVERFLPEAQLRSTQVARVAAENDLRIAATELRNSMGLPPAPPLRLVEPVQPPESLSPPPLAELERIAAQNRPEVLQDEAALRIAQADIALARIQRRPLPIVDASVNITPRSELSRTDFGVGASVSMPLWDAGFSQARERIARAQARSAAADLEQTKKNVAAEVEQAFFDYVSALQRVESSEAAVRAANANLIATNERFRLGAQGVTVVNLVVAQVEFFNANNSLVQARYDVTLALAALNRAVGREK